jgi:hypothetical protein
VSNEKRGKDKLHAQHFTVDPMFTFAVMPIDIRLREYSVAESSVVADAESEQTFAVYNGIGKQYPRSCSGLTFAGEY